MIVGYQVRSQENSTFNGRNENEVLSEQSAVNELYLARKNKPDENYHLIAVVPGDIENPVYEKEYMAPINTPEELEMFALEFEGDIQIEQSTGKASDDTIAAAKRLVETSNNSCSIVFPVNVEVIEAGDGSGDWVPAFVFVSDDEANFNKKIREGI